MATGSCSSDVDLKSPDGKVSRMESESELDSDQDLEQCLEEMYVRQHFGTTANEFVDTIFNISVKHVTSLIPTLKKPLMQLAMADKEESERQEIVKKIDAGLGDFLKSFYRKLEGNSDTLHIYLRDHMISVPDDSVLPADKVQPQYKELVKSLQVENKSSTNLEKPEITEENAADFIKNKVIEVREKLHQKKLEKLQLENRIQQADSLIQRIDKSEEKMSSVLSSFEGSLAEFVQKNIAAAINLPVHNGGTSRSSSNS